jgi:hypothetical protein
MKFTTAIFLSLAVTSVSAFQSAFVARPINQKIASSPRASPNTLKMVDGESIVAQ